jgi:hypothetical protein
MSPKAGWILQEEIAPRIGGTVPKSILCVGAEDHTELIADGVCMAARMIDRVEQQGKLGKVSAGNISYYTLQHLKSGRRSMGSSTVDVYGSMAQLNGSTGLHSLNEVVSESEVGDEIFELHDVISQDREDPATQAARNLDWQTFVADLTKAEYVLVECLINGLGIKAAAKRAKVHYCTMQTYRQKLALKILDFMGADILEQIAQVPAWRIGLDCDRELLACRADRRI